MHKANSVGYAYKYGENTMRNSNGGNGPFRPQAGNSSVLLNKTWFMNADGIIVLPPGKYHVAWQGVSKAWDDADDSKAESSLAVYKSEALKNEAMHVRQFQWRSDAMARHLVQRGCSKLDATLFQHNIGEMVEIVRTGKMLATLEFMEALGKVVEDARVRRVTEILEPRPC